MTTATKIINKHKKVQQRILNNIIHCDIIKVKDAVKKMNNDKLSTDDIKVTVSIHNASVQKVFELLKRKKFYVKKVDSLLFRTEMTDIEIMLKAPVGY